MRRPSGSHWLAYIDVENLIAFATNSHHFTFSNSIEKLNSHTPHIPRPPITPTFTLCPNHPLAEFCIQFWLLFHGHDHLVISNSIQSIITIISTKPKLESILPKAPWPQHYLAEFFVQFSPLFHGHDHLVLSNSIQSTISTKLRVNSPYHPVGPNTSWQSFVYSFGHYSMGMTT